MEFECEISVVILILPLIQKGQLSVTGENICISIGKLLRGVSLPRKSLSTCRLTVRLDMNLTHCSQESCKRVIGKQCRPRSDAGMCKSHSRMYLKLKLDSSNIKCGRIYSVYNGLSWLDHKSPNLNTVDSRYLDPSYLDPITYVELISKSRLFSLCIYCISASRMSNYFYVDTSAISSIIFSPWIYFSVFTTAYLELGPWRRKKNVRCGAAGLSVNENHNRPLINKSIF